MREVADQSAELKNPQRGWLVQRLIIGLVAAAIAVGVYARFGESLSLDSLAAKEQELRQYGNQHPGQTYAVAFFTYVAVTGLSIPGAAGLTLAIGWFFGFWRALVLVSFASTLGATLAFLLSRFLFREVIQQKFGQRLERFNAALQREGAFYLFTLRLIPAVPFFVINAVMGLTPLKTATFWWVSQLGMLPGTAVYAYAGSAVPSLSTLAERGVAGILTPQVVGAFVLLGIFPLVVRGIMKRMAPPRDSATQYNDPAGSE